MLLLVFSLLVPPVGEGLGDGLTTVDSKDNGLGLGVALGLGEAVGDGLTLGLGLGDGVGVAEGSPQLMVRLKLRVSPPIEIEALTTTLPLKLLKVASRIPHSYGASVDASVSCIGSKTLPTN